MKIAVDRARALAVAALLLVAGPARADDGLARRIAALKLLVGDPEARVRLRPEPAAEACPRSAWWRDSASSVRARTTAAIEDASIRFGVAAGLIRSVIAEESGFDPDAVSHQGAMGLMQLMPDTADALGVVCPFDPRANVLGGTRYLRTLRDRFASWETALAAYHAGPERVLHGRIPRETRRYVSRVMGRWRPLVTVWP